jgi:UDP-N-acetylglucosamine transferase subunit ALG13
MILASLGTHPAPMLALESVLARLARDETVILCAAAYGGTPGIDHRGLVAPEELRRLIASSRQVVCHAGPASLFDCWQAGVRPIVVPRDPARGEHVDDHQLRFAARLPESLAQVVDPSGLPEALGVAARSVSPVGVATPFASAFGELCDDLMRRRRR